MHIDVPKKYIKQVRCPYSTMDYCGAVCSLHQLHGVNPLSQYTYASPIYRATQDLSEAKLPRSSSFVR